MPRISDWKINDTITFPTLDQTAHGYRVEHIGTRTDGRKIFELNHYTSLGYSQNIVEGAGDVKGLFAILSQNFINNFTTCLTVNGESILDSPECAYCPASVDTNEPAGLQLTAFPNPASGELTVQLSDDSGILNNKYHLNLFDLQGRLLTEDPDFLSGSPLQVERWRPLCSVLLVLQDPVSGANSSKWVQLAAPGF